MEIPTSLINLLNIVSWNAKKIFGSWMGQERYKKAKYAFLIESSLAISLRGPPVTRELSLLTTGLGLGHGQGTQQDRSRLHPVTNSLTSNCWQREVTIKETENRTKFRK
jgi:hypothetical protein